MTQHKYSLSLGSSNGDRTPRKPSNYNRNEFSIVDNSEASPFLEKPSSNPTLPTNISPSGHFPMKLAFRSRPISSTTKYIRKFGLSILPSFVRSIVFTSSSNAHSAKSSIAALDGLRGLACLFVFNEHFSYNFTHTFLFGYGVEEKRTIMQWPFIRIFWSGFTMVAIFFVISGYVLSFKTLKHIRAGEANQVGKTLSSSVFRRAIRLFLPSIVAVFLWAFLCWAGAYKYAAEVLQSDTKQFDLHEPIPPYFAGFYLQMMDAFREVLAYFNFFRWDSFTVPGDYDVHLWTIPSEFRCSMVLFLTLLGTSRLQSKYRFGCVILFMLHCIYNGRTDIFLFLSGMMMAEIDLIRTSKASTIILPSSTIEKPTSRSHRYLWLVVFAVGLYLGSSPVTGAIETPGYRTLTKFTQLLPVPGDFLPYAGSLSQCMGAILVTWSAANCASGSAILRGIFTNPFSQYLGAISYALYLVHGNILKILLFALMPSIANLTGGFGIVDQTGEVVTEATTPQFVLAWFVGLMAILPVTIWAADLFWRAIDLPCVSFARWVENNTADE